MVKDSAADQTRAPASVNHHTCSCHVGWRERGAQAGGRGAQQGASSSLENVGQGSLLAFELPEFYSVFSSANSLGKPLLLNWGGDSPPHSSHAHFSAASGNQPQPSSCPQSQVPSLLRKPTSWLLSSPTKFHYFQITWMIPHWKMQIKTTEVSSHTDQNDCHQKVYKQQMLEKVWRKGNPFIVLVRMQTIQPLWRTEWWFL